METLKTIFAFIGVLCAFSAFLVLGYAAVQSKPKSKNPIHFNKPDND